MSTQTVQCDTCGLRTPLRRDGTLGAHHFRQYGLRVECEAVGETYDQHAVEFTVTQRGHDGTATEWGATCRCGRMWTGATYNDVDQAWSDHAGVRPHPTTPLEAHRD